MSPPPLLPHRAVACALAMLALAGAAPDVPAAGGHQASPVVSLTGTPAWHELTPLQQQSLAPLEKDWGRMSDNARAKWIALANRFPTMSTDERRRVQARMADWARTPPKARGEARLRFQEARALSPAERQARWEAYRNLPPEQRERLVESASQRRAQAMTRPASHADGGRADATGGEVAAAAKSNIVKPTGAAVRKAVAPSVVQAKPGATTTLINRRPEPAPYIKPGQPKVAPGPAAAPRRAVEASGASGAR